MSKLFVQVERVEDLMDRVDDYFTQPKQKPKPTTNADRIRAMSDEELAEWIGKVTAGGYGMCAPGHYDCTGKNSCAPCWLDWLRQEAQP